MKAQRDASASARGGDEEEQSLLKPPPSSRQSARTGPPESASRGASVPYLCLLFSVGCLCVGFLTWVLFMIYRGLSGQAQYEVVGPVLSSPTDERSFGYIQLANGLQAFLVSDPDVEVAGAAVDVNVGSLADAPAFPGLAHGVEHLLFQGSKPFPGENDYNTFLAANGGASNAYTDLANTNYYLSVSDSALSGALDRLSQFFISPLFNASSLERELKAIDSEHRKNLQSDSWRLFQLLKHISSPSTPFNGFSTGNRDTLDKPGIREAMLAFHSRHYLAPSIRVSVVSKRSIEELAGMVATKFAHVPTSNTGNNTKTEIESAVEQRAAVTANLSISLAPDVVFPLSLRGVFVDMLPVTDSHTLTLLFPLPPQVDTDVTRLTTVGFLSDLIGDEGSGSILSFLKNPRPPPGGQAPFPLAEGVSTGLEVDTAGFSVLSVQVTLAPALISRVQAARSSLASDPRGQERVVTSILHAASLRVASSLFAYLQVLLDSLEIAAEQSIALLTSTGNSAAVCKVADALQPCRAKDGSLLSWPGNASSNAAFRAWSDHQLMASLRFRYPSKGSADTTASSFARAMRYQGPADILSAPSRRVWQPRVIRAFIQRHLRPQNLIAVVTSSLFGPSPFFPNDTEPIYGTRFRKSVIEGDSLVALSSSPASLLENSQTLSEGAGLTFPSFGDPFAALHLPPPNPYLPTDFALVRHTGYAAALGLADIDALAMESNKDRKQRRLEPVKEQVKNLGAEIESPLEGMQGGVRVLNIDRAAAETMDHTRATSGLTPMLISVDDPQGGSIPPFNQSLTSSEASPLSVFWLPDALFGRPRSFLVLELVCPRIASSSARQHVLTALVLDLVKEDLRETAYAAARAGASYSLSPLSFGSGIALSVEAYSAVLPKLLEALLKPLVRLGRGTGSADPAIAENLASAGPRLSSSLQLIAQSLKNAKREQPFKRGIYHIDVLLKSRRFDAAQLAGAVMSLAEGSNVDQTAPLPESLTVRSEEALAQTVFGHARELFADITSLSLFVYGNENLASARTLSRHVIFDFLAPEGLIEKYRRVATSAVDNKLALTLTNVSLATVASLETANPIFSALSVANTSYSSLPPFVTIKALSRGVRAAMVLRGENPEDVNSASVALYQGSLRDSCAEGSTSQPRFTASNPVALSLREAKRTKVFEHGKRLQVSWPKDGVDKLDAPLTADFLRRRLALKQMWKQDASGDEDISKSSASWQSLLAGLTSFFSSGAKEELTLRGANDADTEDQVRRALTELEGDCDLRSAAFSVLAYLLREPAFDFLRTRLQLGYIASAGARRADTLLPSSLRRVAGVPSVLLRGDAQLASLSVVSTPRLVLGDTQQAILVLAQGSEFPADEIDNRAAEFVQSFENEYLAQMSEHEFAEAVQGLRATSTRPAMSMAEEFGLHWAEIGRRSFRFDRRVNEAKALNKVSMSHVVALSREILGKGKAASVAVDLFGKGKAVRAPAQGEMAAPDVLLSG